MPLDRGRRLGDGSKVERSLNAFLVGQEIVDVEGGAMDENGRAVTKIRFRSGDTLLIVPVLQDPTFSANTGGSLLINQFIVVKRKRPLIFHPGARA